MPQPGQPGTTFCFRVKQEKPGWNVLNLVPAKTAIDLAALVCGAPEFLSMEGGEPSCQAAVVLSERGDARVVVALDEVGGVRLVGCPAQLTRLALTTVVQELLVFTGRLWRMPPEEFAAVIEKRMGGSLNDYFSSRAAIGWSENVFRTGLGRSLERGRFPVVLLLSGVNPEVTEAVAHLRSHNLEVRPLGVELYESSGVEVIMPRVLEVAEPGADEDRERTESTPRLSPSQSRTPSRPQVSRTAASGPGTVESVSVKRAPWADEPAPVEESVDTVVSVAEPPTEVTPARKMPWADEPTPDVSETVPPPAKAKPLSSVPPPAAKAAPAARPIWDGTMPGVMAGKRPPRRLGDGPTTHKGHEPATGRNP
jgi:hypothetical protein